MSIRVIRGQTFRLAGSTSRITPPNHLDQITRSRGWRPPGPGASRPRPLRIPARPETSHRSSGRRSSRTNPPMTDLNPLTVEAWQPGTGRAPPTVAWLLLSFCLAGGLRLRGGRGLVSAVLLAVGADPGRVHMATRSRKGYWRTCPAIAAGDGGCVRMNRRAEIVRRSREG
jgi:hypothetical protein